MSIRTGLLVICIVVFALVAGSLYVVSRALGTQGDIASTEARRYQSYKLADELRQSSDDLTRMARLHVVTGDPRYRAHFERILAIRDGRAPRPLDYGGVYWDFVVAWGRAPRQDGEAVALESLMRRARFTDDELALLRQAKQRSDALAAIENRAMHAAQGRFADAKGEFTPAGPPDLELARRLMHGPEYHRAKGEIMAPIQDFLDRVESRTAAEVGRLRRHGERLHLVVIVGLGTVVVLVLVSFVLVARFPLTGAAGVGGGPDGGRPPGLAVWTAWPLLAAVAAASVAVVALSWWLGESIEDRVRADVRGALEAVHRSTARAADDWLVAVDHEVRAWAASAVVREAVGPAGRSGDRPAREVRVPLVGVSSSAGYVILDRGGTIVASDDASLVRRQVAVGFFQILVAGLAQSPEHALVVLPDPETRPSGDELSFERDGLVAAAVPGALDHRIGGVLLLRFDSGHDLSRMLERGRLGESGETYAFDRAGRPVSERRLRSPGGGGAPAVGGAVAPPPPTRMTRAALAGRSGIDVDGYRDDRGIPVVGAWTWNERYGIGIATEVALEEVYGALAGFQRQARLGAGLSVLLIVGLGGIFAWNRASLATAGARLESAYEIIRGHKERMQEELNVGHDLQLSMVPRAFPAFPGRDDVSVHAALRPARELGGDFYDFYFVDPRRLLFCVGDVSDKGVPAALFMAVSQTLLRVRSAEDASPGALVTYLNAALGRDNAKCMFVTLFLGRLDVASGELVYTNAGHEAPYLRRATGAVERLDDRHGPLAGVGPGLVYGESRRRLDPGDLIVVHTDGVTEARDADGRLFADARVAAVVAAVGAAPPAELVERLVGAVTVFEGEAERADDVTVLALRLGPDPPARESVTIGGRLDDLDRVDAALERLVAGREVAPEVVSQLRIVCDEVLSNVIAYTGPGPGSRSAELEIGVRFEMVGRRLVLTVTDDGTPFDPSAVAPPDTSSSLASRPVGGLGIHLVRHLVDEMAYERRAARNVLTLVKDVGPRPAAPREEAAPPEGAMAGEPRAAGEGGNEVEIKTRQTGDVTVVDMAGRLDSRTAGPASTELTRIAQAGHAKVLLNVGGLEYVSSAGLRAILVAAKLVQVNGGVMRICEANATVKQVMEVSGIGSLLHLSATEAEAVAAFG